MLTAELPTYRWLRARIGKGSRLLSVKAFPSASVLAAGGWPCSAVLGRVRGSMCRACVHHCCAGRGYPSCPGRPVPGRVSGQAMDELARDLAARLDGPAVSEC
jgi:hypothetical protein